MFIFKYERYILTALVYFAYFTYGLMFFMWGPVLPDLLQVLGQTTDQQKLGFTVRFSVLTFCALFNSLLFKFVNRTLVLSLSLVCLGITTASVPYLSNYYLFMAVFVLAGVVTSTVLTVCTVWTVELWANTTKSQAAQQGLYLSISMGTLFAPLLAGPFLSATGDLKGASTSATTASYEYNGNGTSLNQAFSSNSRIYIPLGLIGGMMIFSGILFIPFIRRKPFSYSDNVNSHSRLDYEDITSNDNANADDQVKYELEGASKATVIIPVLLILATFGFIDCYDIMTSNYLYTMLIHTDLKLSQHSAVLIDAAYGAANIVGLAMAVIISLFVGPLICFYVNITLLISSCTIYYMFMNTSELALWLATLFLGLSIGPVYGNLTSLMSNLILVSNSIGSLVVVFSGVGDSLAPYLAGYVAKDPLHFVRMNMLCVISAAVCITSMKLYVLIVRRGITSKLTV